MAVARLAALGMLLSLASCAVGPDFKEPPWYSPASWFGGGHRETPPARSQLVAQPLDPRWWNLFGDPELTVLEERVARDNFDVRVATIQLAESRAQRGITAAGLYPSINGNASYEREKASNRGIFSAFGSGSGGGGGATQANGTGFGAGGVPASGQIPPFDLYQYGFDASWEIDLWGRVRRSIEAADASIDSSAEARRNTLLSTLAEVARDYIQLRGVQRQIDIANENVKVQQQSVQLTRERAAGGLGSELDVANATAQLRATTAQLPQLQQQEAQLVNAISLLLGLQPNALRAELDTPRPVPPVPPRVPVGVPSELARRRPDIRQAEAQLHAATADVGVAVADFYPRVTLSASLGIQALQPKNLFTWDARQYGLGPTVSLPIFQGGQLRSTLRLRKEQQQEAAVNYERTVLNAWHEVDNALTAYASEQKRRDELTQAVAENRRALGLAQLRYRQGLIDFLTVLDAQRSLLQTEQQLADSTTTVSNNLVALYKALGGGWESAFPATAASSMSGSAS
jgi:NodT family efflux transporter outer membrane factor (OMF) lipoprotein